MVKTFSMFFKVIPLIKSCRLFMRILKVILVRQYNVISERHIVHILLIPPTMVTGLFSMRATAIGITTTTTTTTTAAVCVS